MHKILRSTGLALAVVTLALGTNAAAPVAGPLGLGTPTADAACKNAKVGGQTKCLGRGQFCAPRNQRDYRRAGFRCAPDGKGRNRLR